MGVAPGIEQEPVPGDDARVTGARFIRSTPAEAE